MITKLVTLGDSWVYGDELGDDDHRTKHNWPALVADHFQLDLDNLGFNGESLQSAVWSMLWWIENQFDPNSLIVVGLTQASRVSWFRSSHAHDPKPWSSHINIVAPFDEPGCHELKKLHLAISACDVLDRFNRYQTIMFFEGIGLHYKLPVTYFDLYPDQSGFFGPNHAYHKECAAQWIGDNTKPQGHPDENGHMIIANKLIYWLESAKIMQ